MIRFEGRSLTKKERNIAISKAPDGTRLIVYGFMELADVGHVNKWCTCLRFFDKNENILKCVPF